MRTSLVCLFTLVLAACSGPTPPTEPMPAGQQAAEEPAAGESDDAQKPADPVLAKVAAAMNASVDPCTDFYTYACGGWLQNTTMPGDETRWGRGFSEVADRNRTILRDLLEASPESLAGGLYQQCMDQDAVDALGATPLQPVFGRIEDIRSGDALMAMVAELHLMGADPLFGIWVEGDFKNPDVNIAYLWQGGLGLPDRDDYVKQTDDNLALQADYRAHIAAMFELTGLGEKEAQQKAELVYAFEETLAGISLPRAEMREADKRYNPIGREGLEKTGPELPWKEFFKGIGAPDVTALSVSSVEYFDSVAYETASTPLVTLKAYLQWRVLRKMAPVLSSPFVLENFAFYGQRLRGQKELRPRWKRCVRMVDRGVGELLGQAYVDARFSGDSKIKALQMVDDIESAFQEGIADLAWMDAETQGVAVEKLHAIENKIGYPDTWRDYSALTLQDTLFESSMAVNRFDAQFWFAQIGAPVDRTIWYMSPPTVNAYYNATSNEIVFPAGILQPPFFSAEFPAAMNYGGIGMVVGHEISHGFDDQGRKFDGTGKLHDWWPADVVESFETRAMCVDAQYSAYEVQPDVRLNGKLTLGENIADVGGVRYAYQAYLRRRELIDERPQLGDLDDKQLFFIAFAQAWCTLATPEEELVRARTDSHSPPRFRVNGALTNLTEFQEAFACTSDAPMVATDRCEIW